MTPDRWTDFLSVQAGVAATLLGLLFVGVSVNLAKIIASPHLPGRALLGMALLLVVLIIASLSLFPDQSLRVIGIETMVVSAPVWLFGSIVDFRYARKPEGTRPAIAMSNFIFLQAATLPLLTGGILLLTGEPAGLYWLAVGLLLCTVRAVFASWVLLVEIDR